jgi:acid phosphatase
MALSRLFPLTLLLAGLAACDTMPTRVHAMPEPDSALAPVFAPAAAAVAGDDNLNAVAWMQTAVEFRLIAGQTWRGALVQLDKAIKTPGWDALSREERANPATGLPPAIIVDIDETMLDNSPSQARLIRDGQESNKATWAAWVREDAARPVPGALEFARAAAARGVTIYYLSNREQSLSEATLSNLRKAGFPLKDPGQFLGLGLSVDGCVAKGSDKGCRRQLVGRSHRVLMQFGDQLGDLVTVATNTPAGREQAIRPYLGWIGERWFLLPNPSYGDWEPALFGNDRSLPAGERRALKRDALRY